MYTQEFFVSVMYAFVSGSPVQAFPKNLYFVGWWFWTKQLSFLCHERVSCANTNSTISFGGEKSVPKYL